MKFSEEDVKKLEIYEDDLEESVAESEDRKVRRWVGTWNNPKMTDEEFENFWKELEVSGYLQFAVFQRECGEENHVIHFQFYCDFKNAHKFSWVKKRLPYGCHFKPMRTTATLCRNYCMKEDTRVSGPYEIGEFKEERQRTDYMRAREMLLEGMSIEEVEDLYPTTYAQYKNVLKEIYLNKRTKEFKEKCRNVEVTYIYGNGGVGKTSAIYKKHGFKNVFFVSRYEKYLFEGYDYQDVIVFDEYDSQIKVTEMNRLLDIYPITLRGLGKEYQACYTKVYILSNISPSEQYKDDKDVKKTQLQAWRRRLNFICRLDEDGRYHVEKETVYEDVPENEIELEGLTRRVKQAYEFDKYGVKTIVYDREKFVQSELTEIEDDGGLPW